VIRAARKQHYDPATALLTAYPPGDGDWKKQGAQSLLVKPVGTQDMVRQLEALLVQHEDEKQSRKNVPLPASEKRAGKQARESGKRA